MAKHKQPPGLAPGIYFGLPKEAYHSDPALGHSGMVDILESPLDYWIRSPLNPQRKDDRETDAMRFGDRCHLLLFEPDRFFEKYATAGMRFTPGTTGLSSVEFLKIKESVDMIKRDKYAADHFAHGYPEVSIFWVDPESGVRLKIRVDYLRTFGGIDYKRCRSINRDFIGRQVADFGYDIQCWHYTDGIRHIKRLLKSGKVKAHGVVDKAWLKAFTEDPDCMFRFFFQRSDPPYVWRLFQSFDAEIMAIAQSDTRKAIDIYKNHVERYGSAMWPAGSNEAEELSIFHIPSWIRDRGV